MLVYHRQHFQAEVMVMGVVVVVVAGGELPLDPGGGGTHLYMRKTVLLLGVQHRGWLGLGSCQAPSKLLVFNRRGSACQSKLTPPSR